MIQLRSAKINDTECIAQILRSSRSKYLPFINLVHTPDQDRQWVRKILIPTNDVVIAQLDGKDVGVLATTVTEGIGWIEQLYIAPGFISRGIGTELLTHALKVLPRPIHLWTFQQNDRAIRFYEYHGFSAIEFTDGKHNEEKCPDVLYEYNK